MITENEYKIWDDAYKFFNEKLFGNNLPEVLITLNRKKKARGYFSFERFVSRENPNKLISEIALNPDTFIDRDDMSLISTHVHEMVHVWQFYLGNRPEKGNYHDKEWGEMMEKIGLMPSSTGEKGGKRCGIKVSHWIIPNGKFEVYCKEFLQDKKINWQNVRINESAKQTRNRTPKLKYKCPDCEKSVSSKNEIKVMCMSCNQEMEEQVL